MRIATLGFVHESNTFAPTAASLEQWQHAGILEGDQIRDTFATSRATLAGYLAYGAEDDDVDLVPLVFSRLMPMDASTTDAYEFVTGRMIDALRAGGSWDGVLLPIHGAAVAEGFPDADGELVRRVREVVGPDVPIGATLDMHANVSRRMVDQADVITVYQTNPHVDAYEQALVCARLIGRTIRGELRPRMAIADPPLVINIMRQGTDDEPMASLLRVARELERRSRVLSVSVVEGFPYADVPEMGMSFLAITNDDAGLAREVAGELADAAWAMRESFAGDAIEIDAALRQADAACSGPVVLLDVGDNVGGGSPGDSTHILHAARRLGVGGLVQNLCDPAAVAACATVGAGERIAVEVGGKTDDRHGVPFPVAGVVTAVTDGTFEDPTPTHGGFRFYDMGATAALRTDEGFDLILTSRPQGTSSQEQLRTVGLEPTTQKIIVAKGVHSPRVAFEPIASELIWVATPGSTSADLSTFTYRHRRRPMFPFEQDADWRPRAGQ